MTEPKAGLLDPQPSSAQFEKAARTLLITAGTAEECDVLAGNLRLAHPVFAAFYASSVYAVAEPAERVWQMEAIISRAIAIGILAERAIAVGIHYYCDPNDANGTRMEREAMRP